MAKVLSKTIQSVREAERETRRSAAGSISRIRDEGMNVRFMHNPGDGYWVRFKEHYIDNVGYRPCTEGCEWCAGGDNPTKRIMVNAINLDDNNAVVALLLPVSVANSLIKKYKLLGSIIDRDYTLTREGSGRDTEYDVTPDAPRKMNLSRYKPIDLEALLQSIANEDDMEEDDDTEDEEETPRRVAKRPAKSENGSMPRRVSKRPAAATTEPRRAVRKATPPEPKRVARKAIRRA